MNRFVRWLGILLLASPAVAGDWPQWGHDNSRNMISSDKGLPEAFDPGKPKDSNPTLNPATNKNIKWIARLGNTTYGNPTVAGGKVYVGTNNEVPRNPDRAGDFGVMMVFDEKTGAFLWQLTVPKLAAGSKVDENLVGLCCSPTVEGDRVYVVTNRCEVICLTTEGLAKGNQGPFTDEAAYVGGPVGPTDADIIWRYDMRDELGVFPNQAASGSVLILGDRLFVNTSNGVDWTNHHIPGPDAPALICLDKKTGKLLGEEKSGISSRTFRSNYSSPAAGKVGDKDLIVFGGGDGICYGFNAVPVDGVLQEVWRCDCNPPSRRMEGDKVLKYLTEKGPSEIIATPVIVNGRVYVATGQIPDHGNGEGAMTCIDASKSGDITATGKLWTYEAISRSMSTVSVADGLVYAADFSGMVHCLNADTGEVVWTQDTEGVTWGSTLLADGKIFIGNEAGTLTILAAGKEAKVVNKISFSGILYSTPVAADGMLFIATDKYLYAIGSK